MPEFLTICGRVQTTCQGKFPAALADPARFWEWVAGSPLAGGFRKSQQILDEALDGSGATALVMRLATEWGRKFLELAKGFEVACRDKY